MPALWRGGVAHLIDHVVGVRKQAVNDVGGYDTLPLVADDTDLVVFTDLIEDLNKGLNINEGEGFLAELLHVGVELLNKVSAETSSSL